MVVGSCLFMPGPTREQLSGKKGFLRFPYLIVFKREAAPSGEQITLLFHDCINFQILQMFMSSKMRL